MNKKLKVSALLSITALLVISVIALSDMPEAEAKKWKGKPDFITKITPVEGTDSVAKGVGFFWFGDYNEDGDPTSLTYKLILRRIAVAVDENNNAVEPDRYRTDEYVTKIHIHEAPNGVHSHPHLMNMIGPNDDQDLMVKLRHFVSGKWDNSDVTAGPPPTVPLTGMTSGHHGFNIPVLEALCTGQTDVNIHGSINTDGTARGILKPFSNACSDLGY